MHKNTRQKAKRGIRNYSWLFVLALAILLFSRSKVFIFLLVFEALDIMKITYKKKNLDLALDLSFIFGMAAAYYYSFFVAVQVFFLGILNRFAMSTIEIRHIIKVVRHIPLFFIASFFPSSSFFYISVLLLIFNYLIKYAIEIFLEGFPQFDKIHFHALNFCLSIILFYLISLIYMMFPFIR